MKPVLLVLDDWEKLIQQAHCWDQLNNLVEIKFLKQSIDRTPDSEIEQAEFLLAIRERTILDENLFKRLPRLKLLLQTGGHNYHIDVAAASRRNIAIALGRQAAAPQASVPELTFAFMLTLIHKIHHGDRSMRNGEWELFTGQTLSGKKLGILGLGRHGSRVAQIASTAFNMDVTAWDRTGNSWITSKVKRLSLEELLETSDVVSIHLRLSNESVGLMNKEWLAKMKRGAFLINTSRGAIVDEQALVEALKTKKIAGAGLDVFAQEPLANDSPLRTLDNVILTPHIGWTVKEVFEEFATIACTQLKNYLNGMVYDPQFLSF